MPATISVSSASLLTPNDTLPLSSSRMAPEALEREHLLDRLNHLRAILPSFAQEVAVSRRETSTLRAENRWLLAEIHRLQQRRATVSLASSTPIKEGSPR